MIAIEGPPARPWHTLPDTKRLHLRRFGMEDVSRIVELVGDWEVARCLARVPHPYTGLDGQFFVTAIAGKEETYAVEREGVIIGCVGLVLKDVEDEVILSRADTGEDWDSRLAEFFEQHPALAMQDGDIFASVNGKTEQTEFEREFESPELTLVLKIRRANGQAGREAELGYWFGREYWGQGFATEAARCLLNHGFTNLNVTLVHGEHLVENPASGRVLAKMGFEGPVESSSFCFARQETLPTVLLSLSRAAWDSVCVEEGS